MSDGREQQYGGVTDEDQLAWLRRNYAPLPKEDNTNADTLKVGDVQEKSLWKRKR